MTPREMRTFARPPRRNAPEPREKGFGLHVKLVLASGVTVVACIGVLATLLVYRQSSVFSAEISRSSQKLQREVIRRGDLIAQNLAAFAPEMLAGFEYAKLSEFLRALQDSNEFLSYGKVVKDGVVLVHSDPSKVAERVTAPAFKKDRSGKVQAIHEPLANGMVEIHFPLMVGGNRWGFLTLGISTEALAHEAEVAMNRGRQVMNRATGVALLLTAVIGLLGLAASVLINRRLLMPILQLSTDAGAIAGGNLDQEIAAVGSSDEIGELARRFEDMRRSIKSHVSELTVAKQTAESAMREEKRLRAEVQKHSHLLETKVRERTAELESMNERLRAYDRMKSEFLSNVSHELRSPLAAISSAAKIIRRYSDRSTDANQRFGGVIIEETDRLTRLINDLLDLSKIEAGKTEWHVETIDQPMDLLEHVINAFRPLFTESDIRLELVADKKLPSMCGDRDRLIQVITNLCSNARKFTPAGGRVRVAARAGRYKGIHCIRITVTDTGPGIPAGQREKVFERFHQVQDDQKPQGTGLGLAICKEVVDYHGGWIRAESPKEGGTRMVVILPAGAAAEVAMQRPEVSRAATPA